MEPRQSTTKPFSANKQVVSLSIEDEGWEPVEGFKPKNGQSFNKKTPMALSIDDSGFEEVKPTPFDFNDEEFEELKGGLSRFNTKDDIFTNMLLLKDVINERKKRADELRQDNIYGTRAEIDEYVMPGFSAISRNPMAKMFRENLEVGQPVEQEEFFRATRQTKELQDIHDSYKKMLEPVDEDTKGVILEELKNKPADQVFKEYGKDVVHEVLQSYTHQEIETNYKNHLNKLAENDEISSDYFHPAKVSQALNDGPPKFDYVSEKEANYFLAKIYNDPNFQKADYRGKEAILLDGVKNFTTFYSHVSKSEEGAPVDAESWAKRAASKEGKKEIGDYLKTYDEDLTAESKAEIESYKKKAQKELMQFVLLNHYFGKDRTTGQYVPSIAGAKKFIEIEEDVLKEQKEKYGALLRLERQKREGDPWAALEVGTVGGKTTALSSEAEQTFDKEVRAIDAALEYMRKIKKMPEHSKESNFFKQLNYTKGSHLLSLGFEEMGEGFDLLTLSNKMAKGEPLTFGEEQMLNTYAMLSHVEGNSQLGRGARIGRNMTPMLPYIASFALTGPVYSATRSVVMETLKKSGVQLMKNQIGKKLIQNTTYNYVAKTAGKEIAKKVSMYELASLNISRLAGSAAQTIAAPQYIANNTMRRMQDDVAWYVDPETNNLVTAVDQNSGEGFGTALWKGSAEAFAEMFTERAGGLISKYMGIDYVKTAAGKQITKGLENVGFEKATKMRLLNSYMKQKGIKDTKQLLEQVGKNQLGWHGIFEEWSEEFMNSFVGMLTGDMEFKDLATEKYWDEQFDTFLTVAAFGGFAGGVRFGAEMAIGNDVVIPMSTPKLVKGGMRIENEKVSFPRWMYQELSETMDENGVDQKAFKEFLKRNVKNMTPEQIKAANYIAGHSVKQAVAKQAAELETKRQEKKKGKGVVEEEVTTTQEAPEPMKEQRATKYDGVIAMTEMEMNDKLKKLKEEQAKISTRKQQLEKKEKRTAAENKELKAINKTIANKESQISRTTNDYERKLGLLRQEAEEERKSLNEADARKEELTKEADTKVEKRLAKLEVESRSIDKQLQDEGIPEEKKKILLKRKAALQGQVTKARNEHRKAISEITGVASDAPQDQGEQLYDGLTYAERRAVNEKNREIEEKHPELVKYGLLDRDEQTGQYVEPTPEYLIEKYKRVKQLIAEYENDPKSFPEYDLFGERINMSEAMNELYESEAILATKLRILGLNQDVPWKDFPWEDLFPSEKFAQLAIELALNPNLSGSISYLTPDAFEVTLSDGRKIKGYYLFKHYKGREKLKEKLFKAVQDPKTRIVFEYQKKDQWNANDEFKDNNGNPYNDRIVVSLTDGTFIGSIEQNDAYAKSRLIEARKNLLKEAQNLVADLADYYMRISGGQMGIMPSELNPEIRNQLRQALFEFIEALVEQAKVNIADLIEYIKYAIQTSKSLNPEFRDILAAMVDENQQMIIDHVQKRYLEKVGMAKKRADKTSKLKPEDLVIPSMEGSHMTAEQKIQSHLRSYSALWKTIADELGIARERVESEFIKLTQTKAWESVTDELSLPAYFESQRSDNDIRNKILDSLQGLKFDTLISIFNFYSNVRILKNLALRIDGKSFELRDLASGLSYDEFVYLTLASINKYEIESGETKYKGHAAVKIRLQRHRAEARKRQERVEILLKSDPKGSLQERIAIKQKQHAEDLALLEEITSIPVQVWSEYFVPKTNETEGQVNPNAKQSDKKKKFRTFDALQKADTYNITTKRVYPKIQSDLAFNLLNILSVEQREDNTKSFEELLNDFFTAGNEELNVFSNLYKLSTVLSSPSEYALSGTDVKGDRFSMLSQYNMVLKLAEEILTDPRSNRIIDFYKAKGMPMDISIINGMFGNRKLKGLTAADMSLNDIMLASIALFTQQEESYLGSLGQFGDKGTLYYAELPKALMPGQKEIDELKKSFPDFDKAVDWLYRRVMLMNSASLRETSKEYQGADLNEKLKNLAIHFAYNYAINTTDVLKTFNGEIEQYGNSLVKLVKRAGSANSPGYRLNTDVKNGVGKEYTNVIVDDAFGDSKIFDGVVFMSGKMASKLAVSMGSIYSKLDQFSGVLSSTKILSSFLDKETNSRGLLKGNWLNIDLLASFPGMENSIYAKLRDLMNELGVDTLSFTSTNKLIESGKPVVKALNADGSLKKGFKLKAKDVFTRKTEDLFVQQDLRHQPNPKEVKQASQFLANILVLPNAGNIVMALSEMRTQQVNKFLSQFDNATTEERTKLLSEKKMKWLVESLKENIDQDLIDLIDAGATLHEPGIQNYIRTRIASAATKEALDLNMMRATTQEIPDADGLLNGFVLSKDKKHYLLPECAVGDPTARTHDIRFKGNVESAISHVMENKESYPDLFMPDGSLMEWEIRDRDGVIPGEPQMLTRVPADHPHSHTIARVKFRLPGNFTMLDKESRERSGSDFDGDARFNTSFYKDSNGLVKFGNGQKGLANSILYNLMLDYINPANHEYITTPINTGAYDAIAEKYLANRIVNPMDARSYYASRSDNMVGVKLKGILTDINTMFSIMSKVGSGFKVSHQVVINGNQYNLKNFIEDKFGAMKIHIVNLQNMAFDNAADPKLEAMGINEHTVVMFMVALMTNQSLNSSNFKTTEAHYNAIHKAIENLAEEFNSPEFLRYTELRREAASQSSERTYGEVQKQLKDEFKGEEKSSIAVIEKLESLANTMNELSVFLSLTREVPIDVPSFLVARSIFNAIHRNSKQVGQQGNSEMGYFDTSSFFNKNGKLKAIFSSAEQIIKLGNEVIYSDAIDFSESGLQVYGKIWSRYKENNRNAVRFKEGELRSINRAVNTVNALMAIEPDMKFDELEKTLVGRLAELRAEFPNNSFLQTLQKITKRDTGRTEIQISFDLRRARMSEARLREIRRSFDQLPDLDKKNFYVYALQKFGTSTSTMHGSYFNHVGFDYRARVSRLITERTNAFNDKNNTAPIDKVYLMEWALRTAKEKTIKALALKQVPGINIPDVRTVPYLQNPKTLEELSDEMRNKVLENAEIDFPSTNTSTDGEVKNMFSEDALQEAFAVEDEALQDFILAKLQAEYPGIQFFTSREAFYDFVARHGGRLENVSTSAIGHAFMNAVFIDPAKARQSTAVHEYSHIYWDALPSDSPVKNKLREFYRKNRPVTFETEDELDERIIHDIGVLTTNRADIEFRGNLFQRFLYLVRQFWAEVKNLIGVASQKDLLYVISDHIWNNHDQIQSDNVLGNTAIRNMIISKEKISKNSHQHVYDIDGKRVMNVTGLIAKTKREFNPEIQAKESAQRDVFKFRNILDRLEGIPEGMEEKFRLQYQAEYAAAAERGNAIHNIAENVFTGADISQQTFEMFSAYSSKDKFKIVPSLETIRGQLERVKEKILIAYPHATFRTEQMIGSAEAGVAGTVDLIVDIGNNQLFVMDFKTTAGSYIDREGNLTPDYTKKYGLRPGIAQGVPASHQGDHGLQLHIYKELLESQKGKEKGEKNKVLGLFIIPVTVFLNNEQKIVSGSVAEVEDRYAASNPLEKRLHQERAENPKAENTVGWIYFNPEDPTYSKAAKALIQQQKEISDIEGKKAVEFKRKLTSMGFTDYAIKEMMNSHGYLTNLMGPLDKITARDVSDMRRTGINKLVVKLEELGYKKADVMGENARSMEELFYAMMYNIKPEDLDKHFSDFTVRKKYKKLKDSDTEPGTYRIRIDNNVEDKNGREFIVTDAGAANLKQGDNILRYYSITRGEKQDNLFYHYTVVDVNKTSGFVTAENAEGDRVVIRGVKGKYGLLRIEPDAPANVEIRDTFTPMVYHSEEVITERHFVGMGADAFLKNDKEIELKMNETDGKIYIHTLFKTWDFFDKFNSYESLYDLLNDRNALQEIYEKKLRSGHEAVIQNIRQFMGDVLLDHYFAEAISEENKHGAVNFMPMTMQFYYLITLSNETLFKDYDPGMMGAKSSFFKFPDFLKAEYIPINFLYGAISKANRAVTEASYDADRFLQKHKKFAHDHLDEMTLDFKGEMFWIMPSEAESKETEEFLKEVYRLHSLYDYDYIERKKISKTARVKVATVLMAKSEAQEIAGKHAKEFYELIQHQPWDNQEITLKKRASWGRGWEEVIDEKTGKPVKTTFKKLREEYAKKVLSNEDVFRYFGNRAQRYIGRNKFLAGRAFTNGIGSMYNHYKQEAKKQYFAKKPDKSTKLVSLPSIRTVRSEFASKKVIEAHFSQVEQMIYNHYMRDVLSPYDWIKSQYEPKNPKNKNYLYDMIRNQIDKSVFHVKDYYDTTEWLHDTANFLIKYASLRFMMFSYETQMFNFAIGHLQNMVYEPHAYMTGWGRLFHKNPEGKHEILNFINNYRKAKNILTRFGIANMVDETQFEELDRFFLMADRLSVEDLINKGYLLLEWAEKSIQIPVFIGMMTEAEWNSYDINGFVLSETDKLTEARADELTRRVGYIHGFYSKMQASGLALTPEGAAVMQFKKFLPSLYQKIFGGYRYDRSFKLVSGMVPALGTIIKIMHFAGFKGKEKKLARIQEALKRMNKKDMENLPFHMGGMNEYFDSVLAEMTGNETFIQAMKNLPDNERKNLRAALIQMIILTGLAMARAGGDDDIEADPWWKYILKFLTRLSGDITFFAEYDNLEFLFSSPVPALSMLMDFMRVGGMIAMTGLYHLPQIWGGEAKRTPMTHYQQDGLYYYKGMPKFVYNLGNIIPAGSFYKSTYRITYQKWLDYLDYEIFVPVEGGGFEPRLIISPVTNEPMTVGEVRRKAVIQRKLKAAWQEAVIHGYLIENGYNPSDIYALQEYEKRNSAGMRDLIDAMEYDIFKQFLDTGNEGMEIMKAYYEEYGSDVKEYKEQAKQMTDKNVREKMIKSNIFK